MFVACRQRDRQTHRQTLHSLENSGHMRLVLPKGLLALDKSKNMRRVGVKKMKILPGEKMRDKEKKSSQNIHAMILDLGGKTDGRMVNANCYLVMRQACTYVSS